MECFLLGRVVTELCYIYIVSFILIINNFFYLMFCLQMEKYIGRFVGDRKFKTFLSDDGSGKGAGLVAAIAARLAQADD